MADSKIEIGTPGIKKALQRYKQENAVAEFVWNGFDAGASKVDIKYKTNTLGFINELEITDNGKGIPKSELDRKFKPFLHSNKVFEPDAIHLGPSATHGKNGIGRLTFFTFASHAEWSTTYKNSEGQLINYSITIKADNLNTYSVSDDVAPDDANTHTGTTVKFFNVRVFTRDEFADIKAHLIQEFSWYLELSSPTPKELAINGTCIDYSEFIGERADQEIEIEGEVFNLHYVRWNKHINEYSRYYFIGSDNQERAKKPTRFNLKGDGFYHSIYVRSAFFNDLAEGTEIPDIETDSGQEAMDFQGISHTSTFKALISRLEQFLQKKRSPFLRQQANRFVSELHEKGIFPNFGPESWEQARKKELEKVVCELYQLDARIFNGLHEIQKATLLRLFSLVMDSNERQSLLEIIEQVVKLKKDERDQLAKILETSQLSSILETIKLINDRYLAVDELRNLVFNKSFGANERDHLQIHIQRHCWLFGENYHLATAAEPNFEKALQRFIFLLRGEDKPISINHPDRLKQMDVFAIRVSPNAESIQNLVLELKNPTLTLNAENLNQVKTYMRIIREQPEFNADNMSWDFYLVGKDYDKSISLEIENSRSHGERHLAFKAQNYKIFVLSWSEIIANFEIKHKFLLDKLKIEREKLVSKSTSADEILAKGHMNSAITAFPNHPIVNSAS